MISRTINKKTY